MKTGSNSGEVIVFVNNTPKIDLILFLYTFIILSVQMSTTDIFSKTEQLLHYYYLIEHIFGKMFSKSFSNNFFFLIRTYIIYCGSQLLS